MYAIVFIILYRSFGAVFQSKRRCALELHWWNWMFGFFCLYCFVCWWRCLLHELGLRAWIVPCMSLLVWLWFILFVGSTLFNLLLLPRLLICMPCKALFCTYSLADSHVWHIRDEKQLSMLPWCRNCEKEIFLLFQSIVSFLLVLLKQDEVEKE